MSWKLNANSPRIKQPKQLKVPLRDHQLAGIKRKLEIEMNNNIIPFGVCADEPGAGKTAEFITIMLLEKLITKKVQYNIVVVPLNLVNQWYKEFDKFIGDQLKVKVITYDDVSTVYRRDHGARQELLTHDVFITTIDLYESFITALNNERININRIIYDEIDTLKPIIDKIEEKQQMKDNSKKQIEEYNRGKQEFQQIKTADNKMSLGPDHIQQHKIIWFISASFDNAITEEGFKYKGRVIPLNQLPNIISKCEDSFIKESHFQLMKPIEETIHHDALVDIFFNYLNVQQLDNLNSLSFHGITGQEIKRKPTDEKTALKLIVNDYMKQIEIKEERLEDLEKNNFTKGIQLQIDDYKMEKTFISNILNKIHSINCQHNHSDIRDVVECITTFIDNYKYPTKTKLETFREILTSLSSTDKLLVFSDFNGTYKKIAQILEELNIKYSELNGGNLKEISIAIDNYKEKDTKVLLIDSSSEGCGLNLENSSHLVFIHKTSELLYKQIIGRAQRPGREGQLKIITLLHKNEIVEQ